MRELLMQYWLQVGRCRDGRMIVRLNDLSAARAGERICGSVTQVVADYNNLPIKRLARVMS